LDFMVYQSQADHNRKGLKTSETDPASSRDLSIHDF